MEDGINIKNLLPDKNKLYASISDMNTSLFTLQAVISVNYFTLSQNGNI